MPTKNEQQLNFATLPNSVEAEQNILCCILRDEAMQLDIIAKLEPDDFYQPNHATIFYSMREISARSHKVGNENKANTVNIATLVDALRRNGKLAQVGDIDYIVRLNEMLPSTANFDEYVSIVKRASTMRKLIDVCGKVTQKAYSLASAEDALTYAEEEIFKLSQGGSNGGLVSLSRDVSQAMVTINERYVNPGKFRGVETGIRRLDRMTNGLHGGELIVLAARPGVGKSALAMNIVEEVSKRGKTVAVFSLEMSNAQLVERMLSSMSTVPLEFIKSGQLPNGSSDIAKLRIAQETICSSMRLYGNDYANIKPSEIASQCRRLKAQNGLDLIVIDYIQLMTSEIDAKQGRQNEVASITRALKLLAKELNVPVIALAQLKRDAEIRNIGGKDKNAGSGEPVLSDLRESGAIEQDADIVLFIHKNKDAQEGNVTYSLIVAKHRNGETGEIPLYWMGKYVRFVDDEAKLQQYVGRSHSAAVQQPNDEDLPDLGGAEDSGEGKFTVDGQMVGDAGVPADDNNDD